MKIMSLTIRNLKEIFRDPVSILLGLAMPLIMLIIFTSINKNMPLEIFSPASLTPGIVIFSFTFIIMFAAMLIAKDKQTAFLVRLFTTPLKPSDFIISYIIPFIPLAILQLVVCFTVGAIMGANYQNIILLLLIFFLTALICICIGVILGSLFSINQVSGIGSILITTIGLISNVWVDLNMIGGLIQKIGYALPFAHSVDVARNLIAGADFNEIMNKFIIVLIYAIVLFVLAIFSFRKVMSKR